MPNTYILAESLPALQQMAPGQFQTIYIDPPYNTGTAQKRTGQDGQVIQVSTSVR